MQCLCTMRGLAFVLLLALVVAGCGGGSGGGGGDRLTVSAASSLKTAFTKYEPDAAYSFAGSDQLAAQIKGGAKPDVFAAANTTLPDELYKEGLVERPVVFAGNRLVVAVPSGGGKVKSLADLGKPGVTIAAGSETVPIGSYAREVIGRLPPARAKAVLANIRSSEPDVAGVIGKLTQGAVDAGFVYATDVQVAGGKLTAIQLPAALQPRVAYGVAVVKGTKRHDEAARFVKGLVAGKGQGALMAAGFDPPPPSVNATR
jgi:molybdate transport system substrate-binding protein